MASKEWKCFKTGCPYVTEPMDAATGIEYLKLHSSQVHGIANKPEDTYEEGVSKQSKMRSTE